MPCKKVSLDSAPVVRDWLLNFASAIRGRDYAAGRKLFAADAVGFGTVAGRCDGLEALESSQWRKVWGVTSGFTFELDQAVVYGNGEFASAACFWQSYGQRDDGSKFPRRGRCTFTFQIEADKCLAVHSHFSLLPAV